MKRGTAFISAVIFPLILMAAIYALVLHHHPGGTMVKAEFSDVGLLVPGDDVRIAGATSGTVASITLTTHGTAEVTIALAHGVPGLRSDATASVRDEDLLGDTYLEVDRGTASSPLSGAIGVGHTFVATRIQDMFDSFDQPTRTALQALVLELGTAVDDRGLDLNQAVLQLAPAFGALQQISDQLSTQSAQLESTIVNIHHATSEVAPRSADLQRLIDGFRNTFAITASRTAAVKAGLKGLPPMLAGLTRSLDDVQASARSSEPVAADLDAVAPRLTVALRELSPFTANALPAVKNLDALVNLTRTTLVAGKRTFPRLATTLRTTLNDTPALRAFSEMITPDMHYLVTGLFSGLGQLAAEPGTSGSPNSQPDRNIFRSELALNCEMFGVPIAPGCMTSVLNSMLPATTTTTAAPTVTAPATPAPEHSKPVVAVAPTITVPTVTVPKVATVTVPSVQQVLAPTATTAASTLNGLLGYLLGR